jgi:hypothetical protein
MLLKHKLEDYEEDYEEDDNHEREQIYVPFLAVFVVGCWLWFLTWLFKSITPVAVLSRKYCTW